MIDYNCSNSYNKRKNKGLWLSWIEQAPPEMSGILYGNVRYECGQIQGSLSLEIR